VHQYTLLGIVSNPVQMQGRVDLGGVRLTNNPLGRDQTRQWVLTIHHEVGYLECDVGEYGDPVLHLVGMRQGGYQDGVHVAQQLDFRQELVRLLARTVPQILVGDHCLVHIFWSFEFSFESVQKDQVRVARELVQDIGLLGLLLS